MAKALFIDDDYVKENSPLGKSVDSSEIWSFIDNAQDIYTQDILGTPLYNDLVDKLYLGVTYSAIERQLVDICSKALVYWSVYLALPSQLLKMRNAGVVKTQSEYTSNSDLTELKYIREEMKNLAEFWNQRIVNFLCDKSVDFPLYNAVSDDMYPNYAQYDSDIYIEDRWKDLTFEEIRFLKKYLG